MDLTIHGATKIVLKSQQTESKKDGAASVSFCKLSPNSEDIYEIKRPLSK